MQIISRFITRVFLSPTIYSSRCISIEIAQIKLSRGPRNHAAFDFHITAMLPKHLVLQGATYVYVLETKLEIS